MLDNNILSGDEIDVLLNAKLQEDTSQDNKILAHFAEPSAEEDMVKVVLAEVFDKEVEVDCSDPEIAAGITPTHAYEIQWDPASPCDVIWDFKGGTDLVAEHFHDINVFLMALTQSGLRWINAYRKADCKPVSTAHIAREKLGGRWIRSAFRIQITPEKAIELIRYVEIFSETTPEVSEELDRNSVHAETSKIGANMELLMDVEMTVTIVLGSTTMPLKDVLVPGVNHNDHLNHLHPFHGLQNRGPDFFELASGQIA